MNNNSPKQKSDGKMMDILLYIFVSILCCIVFIQAQYGIYNFFNIFLRNFDYKGIIVYFFFSFSFILLFLSSNLIIRIAATCFSLIVFAVFISHENITGFGSGVASGLGFGLADANLLLMEYARKGSVGEVCIFYWKDIVNGILESILYISIIYLIFINVKNKIKLISISVGPIIVTSAIYLIFGSGSAVDEMPIVTKVPMQLWYASRLNIHRGERDRVTMKWNGTKKFPMLIYIIDESMRGDLMGINGFQLDTTPFLSKYNGTFYNYGKAISSSNCSAASNIFLQTGIIPRKKNLSDIGITIFKKPNIFQFAKEAGYKTVFIDGQLKGSPFQNYMSSNDFKFIDEYIQIRSKYNGIMRHSIDMKIVDEIADKGRADKPLFIMVQKSGAHFPIISTYPESAEHFSPVANTITDGDPLPVRNSYYNSMRWNVDAFFNKLIKVLGEKNVIIIYTSDHSENLMDHGNFIGYCSKNPHWSEVTVPLFLVGIGDSQANIKLFAGPNYHANYNKASHYNIFPTLLILMGYESENIKKDYGPSVFDKHDNNDLLFSVSSFIPGKDTAKFNIFPDIWK